MYAEIIGLLSNWLYSYILIILLLGAGIFFTVKTKFIQFRYLKESIRVVKEPKDDDKSISSFQALMVSTASRVGTGNIAGISTALCIGGPGAMFWMWLTALLGSASAFVESTLAQIYKKRADDGSSYGGPAYYIQAVLKKRWIGILFAVVLIVTYMGGCGFQYCRYIQGLQLLRCVHDAKNRGRRSGNRFSDLYFRRRQADFKGYRRACSGDGSILYRSFTVHRYYTYQPCSRHDCRYRKGRI